ncbi:MAG: trigger factor [Lachnospiraceae bacterium]|nr:trigger factor [Lachnospiraceae bacterium]
MNVKHELLDNNMAKLTVEVDADVFEKAIDKVYNKQKKSISVPGFRKGKVPRQMVEKMYGADVFYEDAANAVISQEYPKAYDECELDIVSQPEVSIIQMERGKTFIFDATVALRPEVKLGKYEGVTVEKADAEPTAEEIQKEIDRQLSANARIATVDRPIENGDTAVIDFDGSVDGVAFSGGKASNHSLEIGSHSFIDNFEDQLIGHVAGDDVDVHVTFPEDYQEKSLAGKAALFKVRVNEVKAKDIPTLDEEYVQDTTEFDSVDDYKKDVADKLRSRKEEQIRRAQEDEALEKIVEDSQMELPDAMIDTQVNTMINDYARSLAQSGLSLQQYLQFTGMDANKFRENMRPDAIKRIKTSLVLGAVADAQDIEATDEDINKKFEEMAAMYGMQAEDISKNTQGSELKSMKDQIRLEKAVEYIMDNVKPMKPRKKKSDEDKVEV